MDFLGLCAAIVYALPSLAYPFGNDVAIHWYIGRWLLDGYLPYVDGVDTRPPGPYYVHAASVLAFGDTQMAVRIVDLAFVLGCAVLIATFRIRRSTESSHSSKAGELGLAALIASAIHYTFFDDYAVGHPELWQAFFMMGSLWIVARVPEGHPRPRDAFIAGLWAGAAVMFKHTAVVTGTLAGAALVLLALRHRTPPYAAKIGGLFTAGVLASMSVFVLPFVLTGSLDAFYEVMVRFILTYGGSAPQGVGEMIPPWMDLQLGGLAIILAFTAWIVGASIADRSRQRGGVAFASWIALSTLAVFATIAIQRRGMVLPDFNYHFVVLGPFLALSIHWGLRQHFGLRTIPRLALTIVVITACFLWEPEWTFSGGWSYRKEWSSWIELVRGRQSREERLPRYGYRKNALDHYDRHESVARWIVTHSTTDDTVCVRGCAAPIYQVTGLRCPSRFFSQDTVAFGLPEWSPEHDADLRESPPTFLVTFSDRQSEIQQFVQRGYRLHDDLEQGISPRYVVLERPSDP